MKLFNRYKNFLWYFLISVCFFVQTSQATQAKKEFTIEDIVNGGKFFNRGIRGFQWIDHGNAYSFLESDTAKKQIDIWRYDVASGKKEKIVDASKLVLKEGEKPFAVQNYIWSPDESKILFTGTLTARSLKTGGNFFLFDL